MSACPENISVREQLRKRLLFLLPLVNPERSVSCTRTHPLQMVRTKRGKADFHNQLSCAVWCVEPSEYAFYVANRLRRDWVELRRSIQKLLSKRLKSLQSRPMQLSSSADCLLNGRAKVSIDRLFPCLDVKMSSSQDLRK